MVDFCFATSCSDILSGFGFHLLLASLQGVSLRASGGASLFLSHQSPALTPKGNSGDHQPHQSETNTIQPDQHNTPLGVSKNNGTPKSSILIGFSIINHPFWGTPIFGNIHLKFWGGKVAGCPFGWGCLTASNNIADHFPGFGDTHNPTHPGIRGVSSVWKKGFAGFAGFAGNLDMGVSKNRGTPKWMIYNGKLY